MFAPSPFQGMHSTTFFGMSNVEYDSWYSLSRFDRGKMWRKNREGKEKVVTVVDLRPGTSKWSDQKCDLPSSISSVTLWIHTAF